MPIRSGGYWITGLSLWIKRVVMHRRIYPPFSRVVINRAEGQLYTEFTLPFYGWIYSHAGLCAPAMREHRGHICGKGRQAIEAMARLRKACYLPMQKLEKILPKRSSEVNAPVISPSDCWATRKSSANNSPAPARVSCDRPCSSDVLARRNASR